MTVYVEHVVNSCENRITSLQSAKINSAKKVEWEELFIGENRLYNIES